MKLSLAPIMIYLGEAIDSNTGGLVILPIFQKASSTCFFLMFQLILIIQMLITATAAFFIITAQQVLRAEETV